MFARTERLLLRPGWPEDARALVAAIGDEAVARNCGRVPYPYTMSDAEEYLSAPHDPLLPHFLAFSRTRGAPKLVGGCGISAGPDGHLELGYWIARPYWGLGFATEAARATMRIAHAAGLKGIRAAHMLDNPASGHVLRKIGFHPTGLIERRFSVGRGCEVAFALFEQGTDMDAAPVLSHDDMVFELYGEDRPLAA